MQEPTPIIDYESGERPDAPSKPRKPMDPLAMASLIFGLLSPIFCLAIDVAGLGAFAVSAVFAIVATVTGIASTLRSYGIRRIRVARRTPRYSGGQAARAGLLLGLTAIGVAFLMPSLGRARESANRVKCASNLRQIGQAVRRYGMDYGPPPNVDTLLAESDLVADVFLCPSDASVRKNSQSLTAGVNSSYHVFSLDSEGQPSTAVLAVCDPLNHLPKDGVRTYGGNVLFADGSVKFVEDDAFLAVVTASLGER